MATLTAIYTGETVGAIIPDASGNGHHATNSGVAQLAAAGFPVAGAALQFDSAIGSHFDVPAAVIPASGDDFTIAMFMRHASVQDSGYLFGADSSTLWNCLVTRSTGYITMYIGGAQIRGYPPTLANTNDHLIVIQRNAGFLDFYVDDMINRVSLGYTWDPVTPPVAPLSFGLHPNYATNKFNGVLDEVQFWAGGMTQAERQAISTTPSPAPVVVTPAPTISPSRPARYRLTLTGTVDLTTDVELPCSSINARLRSGASSYLQAVIPYTDTYAQQIAARPGGDLKLEYVQPNLAGSEDATEITTVAFETLQISQGLQNRSINLTGHRQSTNSAPGSHTVNALSLQTGTNSKTAIVPGYNPSIKPADTVTAEGISFIVGTVALQASVSMGRLNVQTQLIEG